MPKSFAGGLNCYLPWNRKSGKTTGAKPRRTKENRRLRCRNRCPLAHRVTRALDRARGRCAGWAGESLPRPSPLRRAFPSLTGGGAPINRVIRASTSNLGGLLSQAHILGMRLVLAYDSLNDDTFARTMVEFLSCPEYCCEVITSMMPLLIGLLDEPQPDWRDDMANELIYVLDQQETHYG